MTSRFKDLFYRVILLGFGLLIGIGIFEGYLRFTDQGGSGFYQPDPYLGAFHIPNMEGVWQRTCFKQRVKFNSRGLRDVEHSLEKPKGIYRIVVLGDSYAEALQVKLEESFSKVLEKLLNEANLSRRFEVINLGSSGFGTDQEYLSLKHYGLQYEPDLVILTFLTGNDVRNNYHLLERQDNNWPKPFFILDESGSLIQLPFDTESFPRASRLKGILAQFRIYGWFRDTVYRIPLLHRWFWRLGLMMAAPAQVRDGKGEDQGEPSIPLDFHVYLEVYPPEWEEAWRITKALILRTKEEAEEHGARFLLVSLTDGGQVVTPDRLKGEYPGLTGVRYNLDKPVEVLTEFAEKEQIAYLPLLPLYRRYLKEHNEPVERLHYSCDGHWTPLGHSLAAEMMFKKIVADRLLERER